MLGSASILLEGAPQVVIHGEKIAVRAKVASLGGFSAHAGQTDLLERFARIAPSQPKVVLTHGEDKPRATLAELIQQRSGLTSCLPKMRDGIEL
jgi:metallo-beta-lactamase family protein